MAERKTYNKKVKLLAIGVVVMLFLSYYLSFRKTINIYMECSEYKNQLKNIQTAPSEILNVEQQLASIERSVGMNPDTSTDFQKILLEKVSEYCQKNNVVLTEFPETIYFKNQDFEVETNQVVIEGNFIKILTLVYNLEQKFRLGKIVSLRFASQKDYKTGSIKLFATLYFQNFKKVRNE
ncbi:MAG: hypothetical protein A2X08_14930 [Bacteroidetes bacterium GWA2_32_17]|nr:MAG: hypothetical protein A2X08_14930 [Bacteroidetes bacterium GWA2_32_17]